VLAVRRRDLGDEHPDTLSILHGIARTSLAAGAADCAEDHLIQILEPRRRLLGEDHPDTLSTQHDLALAYSKQGRWKDAFNLYQTVSEARRRVLGEEHPDTLYSLHSLSSREFEGILSIDEAEASNLQVLEARKRLIGENHPDTLSSMISLVRIYQMQGRWEGARRLQESIFKVRELLLRISHHDSRLVGRTLITTCCKLTEWNSATRLLEAIKREFGEDYITLDDMLDLAARYSQDRQWQSGSELLLEAWEVMKTVLSLNEPKSRLIVSETL
jgi:tetratricopeptide (TPR) repeat protein